MPNLKRSLLFSAALVCGGLLHAQAQGIFTGSGDVGNTLKGSTSHDAGTHTYQVTGGGDDMWGARDSFHFGWLKLSGDAVITADVVFPPGEAIANEKAVLMFRQRLDPGSAYADVAVHGDGHSTLQYRTRDGGMTADSTFPQAHAVRLRLERKGDVFMAQVAGADGTLSAPLSTTVALHNPVYVGLGVCSHKADGLLTVTFRNVRVEHGSGSMPTGEGRASD